MKGASFLVPTALCLAFIRAEKNQKAGTLCVKREACTGILSTASKKLTHAWMLLSAKNRAQMKPFGKNCAQMLLLGKNRTWSCTDADLWHDFQNAFQRFPSSQLFELAKQLHLCRKPCQGAASAHGPTSRLPGGYICARFLPESCIYAYA